MRVIKIIPSEFSLLRDNIFSSSKDPFETYGLFKTSIMSYPNYDPEDQRRETYDEEEYENEYEKLNLANEIAKKVFNRKFEIVKSNYENGLYNEKLKPINGIISPFCYKFDRYFLLLQGETDINKLLSIPIQVQSYQKVLSKRELKKIENMRNFKNLFQENHKFKVQDYVSFCWQHTSLPIKLLKKKPTKGVKGSLELSLNGDINLELNQFNPK